MSNVMCINPVKGYIENTVTGEGKEFLMNPNSASESVTVNHEDATPHAMSHSVYSYNNTTGATRPVVLFVSRADVMRRMKTGAKAAQEIIDDYRRFLWSLTVPDGQSLLNGAMGADTPIVNLCWPGTFTGKCKVFGMSISYRLFDVSLRPKVYMASIEFKEYRIGRKWSEEVRRNGIHW